MKLCSTLSISDFNKIKKDVLKIPTENDHLWLTAINPKILETKYEISFHSLILSNLQMYYWFSRDEVIMKYILDPNRL
ncbi:hypothetical protein QE152_g28349 [Popillia japonica]|uniref:Uncharacterized protein n=1 Tax=Popillia japonica TaxID=7064 RepID=A0AAW1JJB4_POPJA